MKEQIQKNSWNIFEVYPGLKAKAFINEDGIVESIKLISRVPKMHYYSFLNDAVIEAERVFVIHHSI